MASRNYVNIQVAWIREEGASSAKVLIRNFPSGLRRYDLSSWSHEGVEYVRMKIPCLKGHLEVINELERTVRNVTAQRHTWITINGRGLLEHARWAEDQIEKCEKLLRRSR